MTFFANHAFANKNKRRLFAVTWLQGDIFSGNVSSIYLFDCSKIQEMEISRFLRRFFVEFVLRSSGSTKVRRACFEINRAAHIHREYRDDAWSLNKEAKFRFDGGVDREFTN